MKQRFSSLDVKVIAHELNDTLVSLRVSNVYDLSTKILLFKFAKPDNKKQLVIETGFRCHLTDFSRTTAAAPSGFVGRLRKYLKTRRVTSVSQVGTDRILEFAFSDGQYRLFLEFFASGNIILTDGDLKILAISRNVEEASGQEPQRIGLQYSLENRQNYKGIPPLTKDRVRDALQKAVDKAAANAPSAKRVKAKAGGDLRKCLGVSITEVPPVLADHILQANKFDLTKPLEEILETDSLLEDLFRSLTEARQTVENITSTGQCKGYIFAKYRTPPSSTTDDAAVKDGDKDEPPKRESLLYEDFQPFLPPKFADDKDIAVLEFPRYNQTVDEFFSSLEGQKLESRLTEREATAQRKLESVRREQTKRIEGLQEVQTINLRKAAAIETNVERVQEAMDAVNGLIAQGMDWVDIGKLIEREKKRHNAVAEIIKTPLKLEDNIITLTLAEEEFEEEQEEDPYETDEGSDDGEAPGAQKEKPRDNVLLVDINLTVSPWGNAREYYGERKSAAIKAEKTQMAASTALKNSEQKIAQDLKKGLKQEKALMQPIRQMMWFEKFLWFISSDGYLVIGAKDASQSDMLYMRYLRKGDAYCHADLSGACSVIVKNNPKTPDAPIPPATLAQAGSLCVCTSEAWDSKAGMGAWWVDAEQVSKSVRPGDYLPSGSFTISGNKNFLPPTQLLMGLGFMFRISEDSKARHNKHRIVDEVPVGKEAAASGSAKAELEPAQSPGRQAADDDSAYGDESADEGGGSDDKDVTRENPLQGTNNGGEDKESADVAEAGDGVSEMKITGEADGEDNAAAAENSEVPREADKQKAIREEESDDDVPEESIADASEAPSTAKVSSSTGASSTPNSTAKGPPKRGKRSKAKKVAAKYKDQDDEDRAAAEALIGARAGRQRAEAEAKAKAEREAAQAAQKERRRAQHQKRQKELAEHEEARRAMMEAGGDAPEDDEAQRAATVPDDLVGTPLPGDDILEAVPVCAPWSALGRFKYKVKMQPGATKKGKAVKEILERLKADSGRRGAVDEHARDTERMWPREAELIKALRPEDVVNAVPVGKVRVMMAGGAGSGGGGGKGGVGKGGKGGKGKGGKR